MVRLSIYKTKFVSSVPRDYLEINLDMLLYSTRNGPNRYALATP